MSIIFSIYSSFYVCDRERGRREEREEGDREKKIAHSMGNFVLLYVKYLTDDEI